MRSTVPSKPRKNPTPFSKYDHQTEDGHERDLFAEVDAVLRKAWPDDPDITGTLGLSKEPPPRGTRRVPVETIFRMGDKVIRRYRVILMPVHAPAEQVGSLSVLPL